VWPTKAREFTVATHWEVVGKGDERALTVISFSCPEADELRPVAAKRVRANLFVSMYLIRPLSDRNDDQCHITRLLSFDLAGGMNQQLSNVIIAQQANLPSVVTEFLQRHEPVVENRYRGALSNETVVWSVIDRLGANSSTPNGIRRPPSPLALASESIIIDDDDNSSNHPSPRTQTNAKIPAVESQAIALLAPVFLFHLGSLIGVPLIYLLFCITAFLAVRQVTIWHLGRPVPLSDDTCAVDKVTCRFSVDLKGVLRFIANKREEREESVHSSAEVSVVHIVASALARSLQRFPMLHQSRRKIPWLWIDILVDASADPIDVSFSENGGGIVTLRDIGKKNVQEIADELATAEESTDKSNKLGPCLVLSMSDFEDSGITIDATPSNPEVKIVAVVGGVRLERDVGSARSNNRKSQPPRPLLSLSLTITASEHADVTTCRRFAEEVHKFLQFPEMCDG
jgi:START domain